MSGSPARFRHAGGPHEADYAIDGPPAAVASARARIAPPEAWTWLRQVHGARVVTVDHPGDGAGETADAAVTSVPGALLAIHTADCAAVLLRSGDGSVVGAAHAGWRGLVAGVLDATVGAMVAAGAHDLTAEVGPHIRARCYEFGAQDLDTVTGEFGPGVAATTGWGTPALDLTETVRVALDRLDVPLVDAGGCTACEPRRYFSHRARADVGRLVSTAVMTVGAGR